jgi:hypothetical protein
LRYVEVGSPSAIPKRAHIGVSKWTALAVMQECRAITRMLPHVLRDCRRCPPAFSAEHIERMNVPFGLQASGAHLAARRY